MTCPVCKASDTAYLTCNRPDCTDGRHVHPARRSADYVTPAARMAEAAALLMSQPNVMCHALIEALDAIKGKGCRDVIINQINQEARK